MVRQHDELLGGGASDSSAAAITEVAPGLSRDFRVMLVGHSWVEQGGINIANNNFAGMEGGTKSITKVRTSTVISRSEYEANPKHYADYGAGKRYNGKDASTIKAQLDRGETMLAVMFSSPVERPSYASLASAAAAYVHNVEARFRKLQASDKPDHQALAQAALGGDAKAYAKVLTMSAPKLGVLPYNSAKDYSGRVIMQIGNARKELADDLPAAAAPDAGAPPGAP